MGLITNLNSSSRLGNTSVNTNNYSSNMSNIKEGTIASEDIDLDRIAASKNDANNGNFLNQNRLYKDIWNDNDNLSFEILDDNTVIIKNGGVGIGYTDLQGINSIINNNTDNDDKVEELTVTNLCGAQTVTNVNISNLCESQKETDVKITNLCGAQTVTNINTPSYSRIGSDDNKVTNVNLSQDENSEVVTNVNQAVIITDVNMVSNKLDNTYNEFTLSKDGTISYTVDGEKVEVNVLSNEILSNHINVQDISNIERQNNVIKVSFDDGSTVSIIEGNNSFVIGNNPDSTLGFGYYVDSNGNLSTIDIFGDYNINSDQYGGNQMHFSEHANELLADPLIMNEIQAHYPGATYQQCYNYLCTMTEHGCGYVSFANGIFRHFQGNEQGFREKFGFDMYKIDENGNLDYNYEPLVLKWYTYNWGNGDYPMNFSDTGTSFEVMERYDDFAAQYGINVTVNEGYNDSYYNKTDVVNQYNRIINDLGKSQMEITAWEFDLYDMNGNLTDYNVGCHAMYVLGSTDSGDLIVSSWGEKYILDLDSLEANGGGMYFYNYDMEG